MRTARTIWFFAIVLCLACAKDRTPPLTPSPTALKNDSIQETHGGDLAVAKVIGTLSDYKWNAQNENLYIPEVAKKILDASISSERKDSSAPLFQWKNDQLVINRKAVLQLDYFDLRIQLIGPAGTNPFMDFFRRPTGKHYGVRSPINVSPQMTPELFRAWGTELFSSISTCVKDSLGEPLGSPLSLFLALRKTKVSLSSIPVEVTSSEIIDSVSKEPVDVGVTLEDSPRILLRPAHSSDWNPSKEPLATDLLLFHEYAHVILRSLRKYDFDYKAAAGLFLFCRPFLEPTSAPY